MYGLETIRAMNAEAAQQARTDGTQPAIFEPGDSLDAVRRTPFLGDACEDLDEHAERVDTLFVDTSGFGQPGEPALTRDQLMGRLDELAEEHGPLMLALESTGQFQAHLAVWRAADLDPAWSSIFR